MPTGQGRRKVELKKMSNKDSLAVTFSKRRYGAFKKASELCTLTGAKVGLIVFSPGNKVYVFGHPNINAIIDLFTNEETPSQPSEDMQRETACQNARERALTMELTQILNQLEAEKKRGEVLTELRKNSQMQNWWERPIPEQSLQELDHVGAGLKELGQHVNHLVSMINSQQLERNALQASNPAQFIAGSSSNGEVAGSDLGINPNLMITQFANSAGVMNAIPPQFVSGTFSPEINPNQFDASRVNNLQFPPNMTLSTLFANSSQVVNAPLAADGTQFYAANPSNGDIRAPFSHINNSDPSSNMAHTQFANSLEAMNGSQMANGQQLLLGSASNEGVPSFEDVHANNSSMPPEDLN